MLSLTNGESSSRPRDEVDFGFEEIDELALEEVDMERRSDKSSRSSHTPIDDHDVNDPDFTAEEAFESFAENESTEDDDVFDKMVTRGRAKRQTAKTKVAKGKKDKKPKQSQSPATRQSRTTRAASVRF